MDEREKKIAEIENYIRLCDIFADMACDNAKDPEKAVIAYEGIGRALAEYAAILRPGGFLPGKIAPCPFCGGDCSLGRDNGDSLGNREYWIDCEEQGCYYRSGNAQSPEEAVSKHNAMSASARALEEILEK